ncbi:MAG TPA: diacylglycerol kinase family protein, partial [Chloroflexota bacterium]|nr:diacylglycerol kinase family protein [Chloroflexota bacterium]
ARVCAELGWAPPLWLETTVEDPGGGQARSALAAGAEVVLACGGDGTIRHVAHVLAGSGTPLGLVPTGTANLLARNLAMVLDDPAQATRIALSGTNRALDIGRVFLMGSWIQLFIFPVVGRLVTKVDPRLLLVVANAGILTSLWLNAHLTAEVTTAQVAFPLFVRAIGTGFGFIPLTVLGVASLPPAQRPGGTALFNLTRELGASIGTAWMSTMLSRQVKQNFTFITSHVDAYGSLAAEQRTLLEHGPGARLFDPQGAALAVLNQRIGGQALLRAFNNSFLLLAFAFLAASLVIVFMRRPQRGGAANVAPH